MADIRVERKRGGYVWLWAVLAVVVVLVGAALLLDRAGYIDLPFTVGVASPLPAVPGAPPAMPLQEV
jgi:hypothetical protein